MWNHQEELWDKLQNQQNNSRLINRECIVISYRREHYQLWWKNVLMKRMSLTLEIILIIWLKGLESTLKRNQFMNELFIKSFINDIDWKNIKEENSWSYAWRFYHKRFRMIEESSIIFFKIWSGRIEINQRNFYFEKGFSCSYKEHSGHTKWREHLHLMFLKITHIYIYYLVIY